MTKNKDWGRNDPKDRQLMALMTKLEKFEGKKTSPSKRGGRPEAKNLPPTTSTFNYTINPERMKRVEPTKTIDGKLMYWCTNHICSRCTYKGLCCNHADDEHEAWKERKVSLRPTRKIKILLVLILEEQMNQLLLKRMILPSS